MYKFFQCQKQMFFDSELEIYYDRLKNDQILLQCRLDPTESKCQKYSSFKKLLTEMIELSATTEYTVLDDILVHLPQVYPGFSLWSRIL